MRFLNINKNITAIGAGKSPPTSPPSHSSPTPLSLTCHTEQCPIYGDSCAGPLVPGKDHDVLFVGTGTSLMAYDVERNADVFYKDVPDGVSSITFGWVRGIAEPLVIVGGHCSIQVG